MANITTKERLVVIEERLEQNSREHTDIKTTLVSINNKMDEAIKNKADQADVDTISNRMWAIAGLFITAFIGLIVWLVQQH